MKFKSKNEFLESASKGDLVLFLGAGASVGCKMGSDNKEAPLGESLARELHGRFFGDEVYRGASLRTITAKIKSIFGEDVLKVWLCDRLSVNICSDSMMLIPKMRWAAIYTVNIDSSVECAYMNQDDRAQNLIPIVLPSDIGQSNQDEVAYYKLHGCILKSTSQFIFSHKDYSDSVEKNLRLFSSFTKSLCEKSFLFIGFGFEDSDFHEVMGDVVKYSGGRDRMFKTYVVKHSPSQSDINYMESEGYVVIPSSTEEFIPWMYSNLKTLPMALYDVVAERSAPVSRWAKEKLSFSISSDVADGLRKNCTIVSELGLFDDSGNSRYFYGTHPKWGDIQSRLPIKRDIQDAIYEDVVEWESKFDVYSCIVLGAAGYGKSTLMMQFAYDYSDLRPDIPVLYIKNSNIFDSSAVSLFCKEFDRPVVVVVDDAWKWIDEIRKLILDANRFNYKLFLLAASRTSEWNDVRGQAAIPKIRQLKMPRLSENEAVALAEKIKYAGVLSAEYQDKSISELKDLFYNASESHLLAGLMTVTKGGGKFDEIIANEYYRIDDSGARNAYKIIALIHSLGYGVPWSLLGSLLGMTLCEYNAHLANILEDIVVDKNDEDCVDIAFFSQHRIIAEELIRNVVSKSEVVEVVKLIASMVNPHDRRHNLIFMSLYNDEKIFTIFGDVSRIRDCYSYFVHLFPSNPYILQHYAIFESNEGNFENARELIDKAIEIGGMHPYIVNTLGNIWLKEALHDADEGRAGYAMRKGIKIMRSLIKSDMDKSVHYHALVDKMIRWSDKRHFSNTQRIDILQEAQNDLDRALRLYPTNSDLLALAGRLYIKLGEIPEAEMLLSRSLKNDSGNVYARLLLVWLFIDKKRYSDAMKLIDDGLCVSDKIVSLYKARMVCLQRVNADWAELKKSMKEYLKLAANDYECRMDLIKGLIEHNALFEVVKQLLIIKGMRLSYITKISLKRDLYFNDRDYVVSGLYKNSRIGIGYLKIDGFPDMLEAYINISDISGAVKLKNGQRIKAVVGLNGFGLYVINIL